MTVFTIANFKTHSTRKITAKFPSRDKVEHAGHLPTSMEMCMDDHLTLIIEKIQQKQFQGKTSEQSCSIHSISPHSQKNTFASHVEFPPGMESIPIFLGNQFLQGNEKFTLLSMEDMPSFPRKRENYSHRYRYINIRNDQLSEQVLCTQCTHISGELPPTEYGNSNMKEPQYLNVNA